MKKKMKDHSDIFICKLKDGDYWAYPSPFVAHGHGYVIQFRNLTEDEIQIVFDHPALKGQPIVLDPDSKECFTVPAKAPSRLYEYRATVMAAVPAAAGAQPPTRTGASTGSSPGSVEVQGGSPPRIIVDA